MKNSGRTNSLLLVALLGAPAAVYAQVPADSPLAKVKVIVPDAIGEKSWGSTQLTRSLRQVISGGVGELIPVERAREAEKGLTTAEPKARFLEAAKAVGATHVLTVQISKKGWLYTAHALLTSTVDGEVQMDFRSQYHKPTTEAEDRGVRIGRKTVQKLEILLAPKPDPVVVVAPDPKTDPPPTEELPKTDPTPPPTEEPVDDFAAAFAGGGDSGGGGEFDGFTDEGGWEWAVRGWVGVNVHAYPHPDLADDKDPFFMTIGARSTLTGKLGSFGRLRVLPLIEVDALKNRLHRVVLEEGFVELGLDAFELRVGWDALTWGAASTLNIVDVVNARDLRQSLIDAPKIGQPMIAARLLFGNHSFSALFLTPFVPSPFPRPDTPFSPFSTPPGAEPLGTKELFTSDLEEWYPQGAARLAFAFDGLDLRASYFHGYSRSALVHLPSQTVVYPLIHSASTDGQLLLGKFALKWELASIWHQATDRTRDPPITLPNGERSAPIVLPDQRFSFIVGLDRSFEGLIGDTVLTTVVEFVGDSDGELFTDVRPPDDFLRFFQNHLILAVDWSLENPAGSKFRIVDLWDLANPRDHVLEARYSQRLLEHFTIALGGRIVLAQDGHKMAAFRQLSGLFVEYRLNY